MKLLTVLIFVSLFLGVIGTGCTTTPSLPPGTPVPTAPASSQVTPVPTPLTDPLLLGTWTLKAMNIQGGTALTFPAGAQIFITFDSGTLNGYSGCNNYYAPYTLTGQVLPAGSGIAIGTMVSSNKYCESIAGTETTYLQILQRATSYTVNGNTLTITDNLHNQLSFGR
ncbi:MAG TPA: META domain-containing protein [Methanoregulaceae archaeon]|nr:META domain-containing protein [Methanoregulaceae archaeon]